MRKLYDFNTSSNPKGIIGKPRSLAWPCIMHRVTKQLPAHGIKFNIFETCILKLLHCGYDNPDKLAEETCLPFELVKSILAKLQDNGAIDDNYKLTSEALRELDGIDNKNAASTTYITYAEFYAKFTESFGGDPLISKEASSLEAEEIEEIKEASSLEAEEIRDRLIIKRNDNDKEFKIKVSYITADKSYVGEECYVRVCMYLLQNGDWRIMKPDGSGWSFELEKAYTKVLNENPKEEKSLKKWKLDNTTSDYGKNKKNQYATSENTGRYRELITALNRGKDGKYDIYAAFEWMLFYGLYYNHNTDKILKLLDFGTNDDNKDRLNSDLEKLSQKPNCINPPSKLDIEFYKQHTANMSAVLPMSVMAAVLDGRFPLNRVFQNHSNFLDKINKYRKDRNSEQHGKEKWGIYGEDDYKFSKDIITTFFPDIIFLDSQDGEPKEPDAEYNKNIYVRLSLEQAFSLPLFEKFDSYLKAHLIEAEEFKFLHHDDDGEFDILKGINALYKAAQCAFSLILRSGSASSKDTPGEKAASAGFKEFPQSLATVRKDMITKTLEGDDQTLGACVNGWLIISPIDKLKQIASIRPDFLKDIDELLILRGHANKSCFKNKDELQEIYKRIYTIIEIIMR